MDKGTRTKILRTAVIVIVAILAFSTLLDKALNSISPIRTMNQECVAYLDNWTAKSVATFGLSKGINAALSVVEDSEVQVTLLGTGVTVAAGEVVRPLNDMIAGVASVALASAVSLGIQRILMEIGAWVGLKWFLTLSMACWLVTVWADSWLMRRLRYSFLVLALVAAFLVPLAVFTTGRIGDRFTEGAYAEAQQELEQLKTETKQANVLESAGGGSSDSGLFGGFKNAVVGAQERISGLGDRWATKADIYSRVAITYIVVFIVQTMLMPILILWGLIKLVGYVLGSTATGGMEERLLTPFRRSAKPRGESLNTPEIVAEAQG